jgi:hypothetical protein
MVAVLVMLAGCRQSDGPRPVPEGEQPNKIYDVGRDLQNLAGGQTDAEAELVDDIQSFDPEPPPAALTMALGTALREALAGSSLADAQAQQVASLMFIAAAGHDLSQRQIGKLGEDVTRALTDAGADPAAAQRVSAAATAVAAAVTRNQKRWYHVGT